MSINDQSRQEAILAEDAERRLLEAGRKVFREAYPNPERSGVIDSATLKVAAKRSHREPLPAESRGGGPARLFVAGSFRASRGPDSWNGVPSRLVRRSAVPCPLIAPRPRCFFAHTASTPRSRSDRSKVRPARTSHRRTARETGTRSILWPNPSSRPRYRRRRRWVGAESPARSFA